MGVRKCPTPFNGSAVEKYCSRWDALCPEPLLPWRWSVIRHRTRTIYNGGDALSVSVWHKRIGLAARREDIVSDLVLGLQTLQR